MSINKRESLSDNVIYHFILSRNLPDCDEIKITGYELTPVRDFHYTAMVNVSARKEGEDIFAYTEIFNCPIDVFERNDDVRAFLYPMLEILAMGLSTPKGTVDSSLRTDDKNFKDALKQSTENFEDYLMEVINEQRDFR